MKLHCTCGAHIPDKLVSYQNLGRHCRAVAVCPECGKHHTAMRVGSIKELASAKDMIHLTMQT